MSRQMGSRISFLLKAESVYGTAPTGNWEHVPILDFDPGTASDLVDDPAIGFGFRESVDVFRGPISYKPKITVPVDLNNLGYWLKSMLGGYAVTGSGPYTHVFKAGNVSALPSLSLEAGYPDANAGAGVYYDYAGVNIDKAAFDFSPTGPVKLTLNAIAKTETKNTSTIGGTPTSQTYAPFAQTQSVLAIGAAGSTDPATAIGNVTGMTLNLDNQSDAQPGVGTAGLILGVDAGLFKATGDITVRFDTTTLYDDAIAQTAVSLMCGYTIDDNDSFLMVMPRVALGRASPGVTGPGGIDFKIPFQVEHDSDSDASIIATIINAVTTY